LPPAEISDCYFAPFAAATTFAIEKLSAVGAG